MSRITTAQTMGRAATVTAFAQLGLGKAMADHPLRSATQEAATKAYQAAADANLIQPERNQAALDAALAVLQPEVKA